MSCFLLPVVLDSTQKENLGIIVQYRVRVRLVLGFGASTEILQRLYVFAQNRENAIENLRVTKEKARYRCHLQFYYGLIRLFTAVVTISNSIH
ncbi:hypothetical protein ACTXT7_007566 [Hymenolepis weldensis]